MKKTLREKIEEAERSGELTVVQGKGTTVTFVGRPGPPPATGSDSREPEATHGGDSATG